MSVVPQIVEMVEIIEKENAKMAGLEWTTCCTSVGPDHCVYTHSVQVKR